MKNSWNRFIYRCWSPVYDVLISLPPFERARRAAVNRLGLKKGDRLLIVGMGTGADLPFLPSEVDVWGVDLSPAMLKVAARKMPHAAPSVQLVIADAAQLPLRTDAFDAVLLFLILSVVPDPSSSLAEVTRVAAPDCRIVVVDKFLATGKPSIPRSILNLLTRFFGTDINRNFEALIANSSLRIVSREPAAFRGTYELIELRHESCSDD